ncbi:hypothetical protein QCA50_011730 [Cerrena zonata]|uniref:Uncharacterized protein n=1 Tax=Cerrena zonata TaxID=2478898 RepID=A0AAW0FVY7_9APHY
MDSRRLSVAHARDQSSGNGSREEQSEAYARQVSSQIDNVLKAEKMAIKKSKKPVKVLLLGQSESGKTTIIKNFQMAYAYDAFVEERTAWKTVIRLNLVRSVVIILDAVQQRFSRSSSPTRRSRSSSLFHTESVKHSSSYDTIPAFTTELNRCLDNLTPLRDTKALLERRLGASLDSSSPEEIGHDRGSNPRRPEEFSINSRVGWRAALDRVKPRRRMSESGTLMYTQNHQIRKRSRPSTSSEATTGTTQTSTDLDECGTALSHLAHDIQSVWTDPLIQTILNREGICLEEGPGFFLDDVRRIASPHYTPTDDDIVRARLRTMGVQEYHFRPDNSSNVKNNGPTIIRQRKDSYLGREWILYDVGGCRASRQVWPPFFEHINAIIFLAPIHCFDERLPEDRRINRLEDSVSLWTSICKNKVLKNVQLILVSNSFP